MTLSFSFEKKTIPQRGSQGVLGSEGNQRFVTASVVRNDGREAEGTIKVEGTGGLKTVRRRGNKSVIRRTFRMS